MSDCKDPLLKVHLGISRAQLFQTPNFFFKGGVDFDLDYLDYLNRDIFGAMTYAPKNERFTIVVRCFQSILFGSSMPVKFFSDF